MTRLPPRARPTFHRGFQMRSRLEATVAEWLDAQGLVWNYEGPVYGNQNGQYLPDFQIAGLLIEGVPHALYFDVKLPGKERERPGLIGRTLNRMERILDPISPGSAISTAATRNSPVSLTSHSS